MPLELGIWRIDEQPLPIEASGMDQEKRLEEILANDLSIASPNWMLIGRQVMTAYGNPIDLLAIDRDGNLVVLELKRDKTPREVVAQILDYASWVKDMRDDDITMRFEEFQHRFRTDDEARSLDEAFSDHFGLKQLPEELNASHSLVVVAAELDPSTDHIVQYLSEEHGVPINAVFFRVFKDEESEYLTRAWSIDPTDAESGISGTPPRGQWNGEYYVSFGEYEDQKWEDARTDGFVSAGGGSWYTKTLGMLDVGDRIWVNVPGEGYVGIGEVTSPVVPVGDFKTLADDGALVPLAKVPLEARGTFKHADDPDVRSYLVGVKWSSTVPVAEAVHEKGFFGNQNTVCRPRTKSWQHTVERLKQRFGVDQA